MNASADTHPTTFPRRCGLTRIPIVIAYSLVLMLPVLADGLSPHFHPPQDADIHERFYSNWMRPDQPYISCCDRRDCAPVTKVRRIGNHWEAQRENDGVWMVVPPQKVEQRRDSPDGRSHLCSRGQSVFCFVPGAGT
jgi:hypothetical protein